METPRRECGGGSAGIDAEELGGSPQIYAKARLLSAPRANESARDDSFACCVVDEGRPLGVMVQAGAPNYLPLLRSKGCGSEQRRLKGPEVYRVK